MIGPLEDRGPIVLDTNVISELAKPAPNNEVVGRLHSVSHRTLITSIVLGELRLGAELLPEGRRRAELVRFCDLVEREYRERTLPLTAEMVHHYAQSIAGLRRLGRQMTVNDAYIAAATVTVGGTLWTRNVKDFSEYPGLRLVDPFSTT